MTFLFIFANHFLNNPFFQLFLIIFFLYVKNSKENVSIIKFMKIVLSKIYPKNVAWVFLQVELIFMIYDNELT